MSLTSRFNWHLLGLLSALGGLLQSSHAMAQPAEVPLARPKVELHDKNYADWRKHILPDTGELTWQQIPWETTFKDGIVSADVAGKPLLLWTMNGHPLGCT
jgi:hypothetical protein